VGRNCRFLQGPGTDPKAVRLLHGASSCLNNIQSLMLMILLILCRCDHGWKGTLLAAVELHRHWETFLERAPAVTAHSHHRADLHRSRLSVEHGMDLFQAHLPVLLTGSSLDSFAERKRPYRLFHRCSSRREIALFAILEISNHIYQVSKGLTSRKAFETLMGIAQSGRNSATLLSRLAFSENLIEMCAFISVHEAS